MTTHIRHATSKDIPEITNIYNQAILKTTATFDLEPKTIENRQLWLNQRSERHPVIVCEMNNKIIGWASLSSWSDKLGYEDSVENSLYVIPESQGHGVGSALMQKLLVIAKENKIHALIARIADGNEQSIRLHLKFSFEKVGLLKEVGKKFGRHIDVHLYQLILNELN